ncbi:MAG: beta-N-acetylhexosaminidase [Actinobacteria bacterium]|nr:beta-N-acetylhexosaminidase [Actinomycetota bacterium]
MTATHPALLGLLPLPRHVEMTSGEFVPSAFAHVIAPSDAPSIGVADHLVADLQAVAGVHLSLARTRSGHGDIELSLHPHRADLGAEGYELLVAPDGVAVVAATPHGLWNGTRTFVQLLTPGTMAAVPALHIIDVPRFEWRGAMLDVARHFFSVDHVIRFVELIARYKLNRLHLHLSDDQGWRLEIPGWPALTAIGGSTATKGDQGGWFSVADYAEIVAHAERHFVTVVPEIDMPGHTNAALASVPELNVDDVAPPLYTGVEVGFSSLRLDRPATARFVRDVVATLAANTPGPYLHIGGDEAHSTDHDEYLAFVELLQREVAQHGKRMVGWEEIAQAPLHRDTLVQHWLKADTVAAAPTGTRFIMSPARHTYLDMKHQPDDPLGRRWAGAIDLDAAYEWDPAALVPGVLDPQIAGVEAPLWTEKVRTFAEVEQLCFPRLVCLAEVGWTPQPSRRLDEFLVRVGEETRRLAARGVHVHRSALVT